MRLRSPVIASLVALASALAPAPAGAAWSPIGNPVCNVPGDLFPPVSLNWFYSPTGALIGELSLYWQDARTDAGDIYAGGLSDVTPPDPAPGTPGTPIVTGPGLQAPGGVAAVSPVLCLTQFGCAVRVLVWSDQPLSGQARVRAMRSFDEGADWGASGLEVATGTDDQLDPVVVPDGGTGVIVAWRNVNAEHHWVYAQHLDGAGVAQWGASGVLVGTDTTAQSPPLLASDGAGGAYVLRFDLRGGSSTLALFRLGPDGSPAPGWPASGLVIGTAVQRFPPPLLRVAATGTWVVWAETGPLSDLSLASKPLAALIAPSGAPAAGFTTAGVPVVPFLDGEAFATDAAVGYAGDLVVAYEYAQRLPGPAASGTDLRARRILADGGTAPGWPATGVVVCDEAGTQRQARVLYGGGSAMFAWTDERSGEGDIYAQMLLPSGARSSDWPSAGLAVCAVPGVQQDPVLGRNAVGGGFVVWRDARDFASDGWDLYGQTVTSDGRLDSEPAPPPPFALASARPNPARHGVRIHLSLPEAREVRLDVLDVAGRRVHGERMAVPAGERDLAWDLRDANGGRVRPGLYLVRVRAGEACRTQRVVVTE